MCKQAGASVNLDHDNMETVFCIAESYRQAEPDGILARPVLQWYGR